jgi:hypothetical protein
MVTDPAGAIGTVLELPDRVAKKGSGRIIPLHEDLRKGGDALALEVVEQPATMTPAPTSLDQRIMAALADAVRPLPLAKLRARCRVRAATLYQRIAALAAEGRISKTDDGYRLAG